MSKKQKKTLKGSKGQAQVTNDLDDAILNLLKKAIPEAYEEFVKVLKEIEVEAKANWLVRQPVKPVRDNEGNIKQTKEGKPRFRKQPPSKRSIDKFKIGQRINQQGEIEVFLENTAPYAWAIKPGIDSKGDQGKEVFSIPKKRIADELMVKPMKENTNRVLKAYTEALMKTQK